MGWNGIRQGDPACLKAHLPMHARPLFSGLSLQEFPRPVGFPGAERERKATSLVVIWQIALWRLGDVFAFESGAGVTDCMLGGPWKECGQDG